MKLAERSNHSFLLFDESHFSTTCTLQYVINPAKKVTNKDPDNAMQCRYYDIEEIWTLKIPNKSKSLSSFILIHALLARILMI